MNIKTYIVPCIDEIVDNVGRHVIAIDVLRASTTVCTALYYGAKEIIPVFTIEEARGLKRSRREAILGGKGTAQNLMDSIPAIRHSNSWVSL